MEQRRLGGSGLVVSTVGLGCNNLGRPCTATGDWQPDDDDRAELDTIRPPGHG